MKDHKNLKGLKTQNLRDHMSEEELIFSALAKLSTRKIAEVEKAEGLEANKVLAKKGEKRNSLSARYRRILGNCRWLEWIGSNL